MKRALIALAISIGMIAVGSSVCLPGICGCVSWLGIPDLGGLGEYFLYLALAGVLGTIVSLCWLAVAGVMKYLRRSS
jgi:hypothetical protein